jgi:hypothetical protein
MQGDLVVKAAVSAAAVGLLLSLLRHAGPRTGGLAAAVPVNSLPALFWLSVEHGNRYAASAAFGSLAGTTFTLLLGSLALVLGRPLGGRAASAPRRRDGRRTAVLSMAMAGTMSALVSALSRHGGPLWCGLVAAAPVIAACAMSWAYREGGAPLAWRVLGGYVDGLWAKAAFLAALGGAWAAGAGAWAWPAAVAGASITLLAQHRLRSHQTRRYPHG